MGTKLKAYMVDKKSVMEDLKKRSKQVGTAFNPEEWQKKYGERMEKAGNKMRAVQACANHPTVTSALQFLSEESTRLEREKMQRANQKGAEREHHHHHPEGEVPIERPLGEKVQNGKLQLGDAPAEKPEAMPDSAGKPALDPKAPANPPAVQPEN